MDILRYALLLFFLASSAQAAERSVSGIAAIVNDDIITTYEVSRSLSSLTAEAEKKGALSAEEKDRLPFLALNQLIDRKLVEQKVRELNIKVSEEEVRQAIEDVKKQNNLTQETLTAALRTQGLTFDQYKEQFREQLERLRLMSQEVRSKVQVGEREIEEYYAANRTRFSEDDRFHARHIFFRMKKDAPADEVKGVMAKALTVLQEAKGGKDFALLAKENSDDPAAASDGGDLGTFKKGEMLPELEGSVVAMKAGEVSDLVSTPAGFHIVKLEELIPGKVRPLDQVRAEIEDTLYKTKSEERFTRWLDDLKKSATIEIRKP